MDLRHMPGVPQYSNQDHVYWTFQVKSNSINFCLPVGRPPTISALHIHGCGQIKEDRTVKSLHAETRPPEMFGMHSRQHTLYSEHSSVFGVYQAGLGC